MFAIKQNDKINSRQFSIIMGEMSPAGYPIGNQGQDWDYISFKGIQILNDLDITQARKICKALNAGGFRSLVKITKEIIKPH